MAVRYTDRLTFDSFSGIDQSSGAFNINPGIAMDARNVDTTFGEFRPGTGYKKAFPDLPANAVRLMTFYRRNHPVMMERRVLVAATENAVFMIYEGCSGWIECGHTFQSGEWSWVTYEAEYDETIVDTLIMSNAQDGMWVLRGDTLTLEQKPDVKKFGILERHNERIWGTCVAGEPDNLYYSQPYEPFEWGIKYEDVDGQQVQLPEQSGGMISYPTWDGDEFTLLKRYGSYLLAFKKDSVFTLMGATAGEFSISEAFGSDGAVCPHAVVTDSAAVFYVAQDGLKIYNGESARKLDNGRLDSVFGHLGKDFIHTACAAKKSHKLYFAVPVKTDTRQVIDTYGDKQIEHTEYIEPDNNNRLVEYDVSRGTYMIHTGVSIACMLNHGGELLFITTDNPAHIYVLDGTTKNGEPVDVYWASAWQDFGYKNEIKSAFVAYINGIDAEVNKSGVQKIEIGIETEKKVKTKEVWVYRGAPPAMIKISNRGRRFRLIIKADSMIEWAIRSGIMVTCDVDGD